MAGIYLHIPFCRQACAYCNFHFTTSLRYKKDLVKALQQEIVAEKDYLRSEPVSTIYLGGGTPSLLETAEVEQLINTIARHFTVSADAEITLEANPDDITRERLPEWRQAGVNRLSMGVQSFFEEELRWMNRAHNALQAQQAIEWSLDAGFHNMSIDLIYGSPILTDAMWEANVRTALSYSIPHLSCYALTVEEKTPLDKLIRRHEKENVDADRQAAQFLLLMKWLGEAGYEHYEVSNFALPGRRSRHNSSYWQGKPYLGVGPSAHSYNGTARRWNVANNAVYIKTMAGGRPQRETEVLTDAQRLNEFVMISLRTMEGLDLAQIGSGWGANMQEEKQRQIDKYVKQGLLFIDNGHARLTDEGMLHADGIASDLFVLKGSS